MTDTRERILQTALEQFAVNGYEAVSVSDIAGALGITKGALYRHYKNKRDIFESILSHMAEKDSISATDFSLPTGQYAEMPAAYRQSSIDSLIAYSKSQFRYWTQDSFAANFRRMLTLEQYRSDEMARLYQQYLAAGPLKYVMDLFKALQIPNPEWKARTLYSAMFLGYSLYDGASDKQKVIQSLDENLDAFRMRLIQA